METIIMTLENIIGDIDESMVKANERSNQDDYDSLSDASWNVQLALNNLNGLQDAYN